MEQEYLDLLKKKEDGEEVDEKKLEKLRAGLDSLSREDSELENDLVDMEEEFKQLLKDKEDGKEIDEKELDQLKENIESLKIALGK